MVEGQNPGDPIFGPFRGADTSGGAVTGAFAPLENDNSVGSGTEYCERFTVDSDQFRLRALLARNNDVCVGDLRLRIRDPQPPHDVVLDVDFPEPETGAFEWVESAPIALSLAGDYLFCLYSAGAAQAEASFYLMEDSASAFGGLVITQTGQVITGVRDTMIQVSEKVAEYANSPPIAFAGADRVVAPVCDTLGRFQSAEVDLDGGNSFDPDGDELRFTWSTAGVEESGERVRLALSSIGEHQIQLRVADDHGATDTDTLVATVLACQTPDYCDQEEIKVELCITPANVSGHPCEGAIHREDDVNDVRFCAGRVPRSVTVQGQTLGEQFKWYFSRDPRAVIGSTTTAECIEEDPAALWLLGSYSGAVQTQMVTLEAQVVVQTTAGSYELKVCQDEKPLTIAPPPAIELDCEVPEWVEADNVEFNFETECEVTVTAQAVPLADLDYTMAIAELAGNECFPGTPALGPFQADVEECTFARTYAWDGGCPWQALPIAALGFTVTAEVTIEDVNGFVFTLGAPFVTGIEPTDDKEDWYVDARWYLGEIIAFTIACAFVCALYGPLGAAACGLVWVAYLAFLGYMMDNACDAAHDPVQPDWDYTTYVLPDPLPWRLPDYFDASVDELETADLLGEDASVLSAAGDTYKRARAKLAGAAQASDRLWMERQSTDVLRYGSWASAAFQRTVDAAQDLADLAAWITQGDVQGVIDEVRANGLPEELKEALERLGVPVEALENAIAGADPQEVLRHIQDPFPDGPPDLADFLLDQSYADVPRGILAVAITTPRGTRVVNGQPIQDPVTRWVRGTVLIDGRVADKTLGPAPSPCSPAQITELTIDGSPAGNPFLPRVPYRWNTRGVTDGPHDLAVKALSRRLDTGTGRPHEATDTIRVWVDNTPPSIQVRSPQATAYRASSAPVPITVAITDNLDPRTDKELLTQIYIDGDFHWDQSEIDIAALGPGSHVMVVEARDAAGNTSRVLAGFSVCSRDDDGTREGEATIDYNDDFMEKTLILPGDPLPVAGARLWLYGQPYNYEGQSFVAREDYRIEVNGDPAQRISFDVGEVFDFDTASYRWVSFDLPAGWLVQGANRFRIFEESPFGAWDHNNLRVGVDTDNDADRSWWYGNGFFDCGPLDNQRPDRCPGELMIYLECPPATDCNHNGVEDTTDIAGGHSSDCNANGVPDECDVSFALSRDCNQNGSPDGCDLARGSSLDCDANEVPDECEASQLEFSFSVLDLRIGIPGGPGAGGQGPLGPPSFELPLLVEENPRNPCFPHGLRSLQMALVHDSDLVSPEEVVPGASLPPGSFLDADIVPGAGVVLSVVFEDAPPFEEGFPAVGPQEMARVRYEVSAAGLPPPGKSRRSDFRWASGQLPGELPGENAVFLHQGPRLEPRLDGGVVLLVSPALQRPADCDQNGRIELTDGVCLLGYLFRGRPARLPCGDGTPGDPGNQALLDMDGNARLELTDAVRIFRYLFVGGPPPPLCTDPRCSECVTMEGCPQSGHCP